MHRRSDSLRPRRCAGTPFTVAASLALTVGLLGAAPAAHAATTTPTTPTAPASQAPDAPAHAAQTSSIRGELLLEPGEKVTADTRVKWTVTITNTGEVPLHNVDNGHTGERVDLAIGQSKDLTVTLPLGQSALTNGTATLTARTSGLTDTGVLVHSRATGTLTLPTTSTTTPTTPATPATPTATATPTAPASQAPDAPAHAAQSSSVRGELLLEPGEKVTADTRVKWTVTITNTGELPLHDVDNGHTGERVDLAVGESKDLTVTLPLGQSALAGGTATLTARTSGATDTGVLVHSRATGTLTLPTTSTTTPTTPATPATPATPTATATPTTTGTETGTTATAPTTGTETGTTTTAPTTGTETTAGTTVALAAGAVAGSENVADGAGSLKRAVDAAAQSGAGAGSASASASTTADKASGSTSAKSSATKSASAAHLAQTGVDTAAALPAAGILGLLGALGLLLGARRRRNRTAD